MGWLRRLFGLSEKVRVETPSTETPLGSSGSIV
jgi:hypothetical protein